MTIREPILREYFELPSMKILFEINFLYNEDLSGYVYPNNSIRIISLGADVIFVLRKRSCDVFANSSTKLYSFKNDLLKLV